MAKTKRTAKPVSRMKQTRPLTAAEKMRAYRARKKKAGYKLAQMWVLDLEDPKIGRQVRRELKAMAGSRDEEETLAFIEATADLSDWK